MSNQDKSESVEPVVTTIKRSIKPSGGEKSNEEQSEIIEIRKIPGDVARVSFKYPISMSLAFQSVGIEVGISLPCKKDETEAAFKEALDFTVRKTKELMPEMESVLNKLVDMRLEKDHAINCGKWQSNNQKK